MFMLPFVFILFLLGVAKGCDDGACLYVYILGGFDGLDCPEAYDSHRMLVKGDCLVYESGGLMINAPSRA